MTKGLLVLLAVFLVLVGLLILAKSRPAGPYGANLPLSHQTATVV
jgi:hypothetical protein